MSFTQRITPCDEHDDCTAITCTADVPVVDEAGVEVHPAGTVVWVSHWDSAVHAEHRINPDYPAERDGRAVTWSEPCDDCQERML